MTVDKLVTDTRVILADNATVEDMEKAKAEHPGKTIVRAKSLHIAGGADNTELTTRVRRLEVMVAQLIAAQNAPVRSVSTSAPEKVEAPKPEPKPKAEVQPATDTNLSKALTYLLNRDEPAKAKVKAPKLPAPVVIKTLPPKAPRLKVADMTMDQLRARAEKLGGKPDRIVAGKSGTARTIALRNWIIRKQKAIKAAKA